MERLATEFLVPFLREKSGRGVETFTLRTTGVFESVLHERIDTLPASWPGATLAYLPSLTGVDLRVTVSGADPREVGKVAARAYEDLKAKVAPVVYAEGTRTMEEVVGALLLARELALATAESCTGGLLAKRITDTPGSSRYFERGFVTYSNRSKVELLGVSQADLDAHGAVSTPVAEQMASGAARAAGVEVGIGITGVAGPDGGTEEKPVGTVFIGVHGPPGGAVRRYHFVGTRNSVRMRSAQAALDLVRRHLLGLPLEASLG
jgi:nicotinamide-nucleotide amidase